MARTVSQSRYFHIISCALASLGVSGLYDPRHVEAYIRIEYGTLDHLSADRFRAETEIAVGCIQEGGVESAEALAESYGL